MDLGSPWIIAAAVSFGVLAGIALWRNRERGPADPRTATKIERVRAYRAAHGVGLKQALEAVEAEDRGALAPPLPTAGHAPSGGVEALAREGRMIEAIKLYRKETGASLLEAKSAVERLRKS